MTADNFLNYRVISNSGQLVSPVPPHIPLSAHLFVYLPLLHKHHLLIHAFNALFAHARTY